MAYYAALVSTVQLLEEMRHSQHQYSNSLFAKQQIVRLYKTFRHLQELLEDYSPNDKDAAGLLDRIRDAACQTQDLIESHIPDSACRAREIVESHIQDSACRAREIVESHIQDSARGEQEMVGCQPPTARDIIESRTPNAAYRAEHYDFFEIPDAFYIAESIIESAISDRIREPNCLEEIVHIAFWQFVSACHNSEHVNEEVVFAVRKGYRDLLKLMKQLGSTASKGCQDLRMLVKEVDSINMGKGYLDLVELKEEFDSVVLKGYQELLKLKEELDSIVGDQYLEMVKEVVDFIVRRGNQDLERVKEEVNVIVGKGFNYVLEKIKEVVDSIVRSGYEDVERMKEEVYCIVGRGYQESNRLKEELDSVDSVLVKGYQNLVKLKEELGAVAQRGHQNFMKKVKKEVDSIVERGYQDLERMEEDVDSVVEKIFKDLGKELVGSIVGRGYQVLERVKEEIYSIMGRGYRDWERVKIEIDSPVIKGYQDLVELKKELGAVARRGNRNRRKVKEVVDFVVGRGYQNFERMKEEVDSTVEKGYKDIFEKVKEEVDSIVEDLMRINKKGHTAHQDDLQPNVGASTQAPSDGTRMVGFEEHLNRIKDQLFGQSSGLEVISVAGMGGVGKTTLARNIFDDKHIDNHFDYRVWVTISQSYHLPNILLAMAKSLNIRNEKLRGFEDGVLGKCIYQHLFGQRYLIIMDDVWDPKIWKDVKWIFPKDGESRGRVIITTRQSDVASLASESEFKNKIPFLDHDQSWNLFNEKVLCPPELEDIGRSMVENCGGLPLAIVVVAGLLSKTSKTRDDWEDIASRVSSTASENDEHFSKMLSLSYDHLPHHLKPCFLYFGGFPEDYEISISKLVKLWVAEGFLKPIASKCLEEAAEEYLEEVVERNLVLITKQRSNGKSKSCIMHDLLRDLCLERARHEHFLLLPHIYNAADHHTHRLFIHTDSDYSSSDIDMLKNNVRHVRSIVSFDEIEGDFISHLSSFKPLRVIDAPDTRFSFLIDDGVLELLNLRFLELDYPDSNIPSSISQLQHLQTIIARSWEWVTRGVSLPAEIWEMPQLRHVLIHIVKLPPSSGGESSKSDRLPSLQTLSRLTDFTFTSRIAESFPSIKKLKLKYRQKYKRCKNAWTMFGLGNLVHLHQLEILAIEIDVDVKVVIPFPESFAFPSNLRKLTLKGCRLPWRDMTAVGAVPHLQVLKLRCDSFVGEVWESNEGEFSELKFLEMGGLYEIKYWITESSHFPSLEHLVISYCPDLEGVPSEIGEFPNLKLIEVWSDDDNSRVKGSALEIQEEQSSVGNETLQVRVN